MKIERTEEMASKLFFALEQLAWELPNRAPFSPPVSGNNDGKVRDRYGNVTCDCIGHELMAATIADVFNALCNTQGQDREQDGDK